MTKSLLPLRLAALAIAFVASACPQEPCDPSDDECSCDPADADACPDDFLCRPVDDENICVSAASAGRIPSCFDDEGLDVFAAEANGALSVSWKVNGEIAPAVATDRFGTVYVAWQENGGGGDTDIVFARAE